MNGGRFYSTFHGLSIISHNDGTPGFSSSWVYVVEKDLSIIVLLNRQDYAPIDKFAWDVLSFFEPSLKYPETELAGAAEEKMAQTVLEIIYSLETGAPFPEALSEPLEHFLASDNGKGYWT